MHLLSNLHTHLGAELGRSGYRRDRDLEFAAKHIPRAELLAGIEATHRVVAATLTGLSDEQLAHDYPQLVFEAPTSLAYLLVHLTTHLTYHLGQINYHRRLLDKPT